MAFGMSLSARPMELIFGSHATCEQHYFIIGTTRANNLVLIRTQGANKNKIICSSHVEVCAVSVLTGGGVVVVFCRRRRRRRRGAGYSSAAAHGQFLLAAAAPAAPKPEPQIKKRPAIKKIVPLHPTRFGQHSAVVSQAAHVIKPEKNLYTCVLRRKEMPRKIFTL